MDSFSKKFASHSFKFILIFLISLLIVRYQWHLLTYLEWYDEVEHIIGSKMIIAGHKLYLSIHALHGPLVYLSGVILELLGSFGVREHRIPIALLQWVALFSLYFCPINTTRFIRLTYALTAATVMLIYFSDLFGHTYIFQSIAGLFLIIILSQYTFTSLIVPERLTKYQIILGNVLIACLPFLALTYIPLCLALFFCSLHKKYLKISCIAFFIGFLLNTLFLVLIGSIQGYFVLHYWVNLYHARHFVEGEALGIKYFANVALNSISSDLLRFSVFSLISAGIYRLGLLVNRFPWRAALLGLGISSLLTRSLGFQGLPLLYLSLTIPLLFFSWNQTYVIANRAKHELLVLPLLLLCLIKLYLLNPAKIEDRQIRTTSHFSEIVKSLTNKEDTILAWSWQQYEYLLANRLPTSGNFFYLPWQDEYYKMPIGNIYIDSCSDIRKNKTKVLLIDQATYGGAKWADYAPSCIFQILANDYQRIPNTNYYLRNDVYTQYMNDPKLNMSKK